MDAFMIESVCFACVLINYCILLLLHNINTYKYRREAYIIETATLLYSEF